MNIVSNDVHKRQRHTNDLQQFAQMQQKQNFNEDDERIKRHFESFSIDDPERILDQFLIDWQPIKRYPKLAFFNLILCLLFGSFGVLQLIYSFQIKEQTLTYKSLCLSPDARGIGNQCIINDFIIQDNMDGPVYVYYQLTNFFQATPLFANSKSIDQLRGQDISVAQAQNDCGSNYFSNYQMGKTISITGDPLNPDDVAIPCGIYAYTYFNGQIYISLQNVKVLIYFIQDTFQIEGVLIDDSDIGSSVDISSNYKMNPSLVKKAWINLENQHLMVWMRPSPASTFRKYYGKIQDGLQAGIYKLTIMNNFDADLYKTNVSLVVTTLNSFGQKNILGSCVLIAIAIIFLISTIICYVKYRNALQSF